MPNSRQIIEDRFADLAALRREAARPIKMGELQAPAAQGAGPTRQQRSFARIIPWDPKDPTSAHGRRR